MNGGGSADALRRSGEAADTGFSAQPAGRAAEGCGQPTWIEFQLIGEDRQPIPYAKYRVELPDGSVREGALDREGIAGFDGLHAGDCKICFPELDQEAWEPAGGI